MSTPLLTPDEFTQGSRWTDYLDRVPRSRRLQEDRYNALSDADLEPFTQLQGPAMAVMLTMETCADSAWALPQIVRYLHAVPGLDVRVFFREERPELQDRLLTNGKRAVPKLALLDETGQVIGEWGPRPAPIQRYVAERAGKMDRKEWFPTVLHYYKDEGGPVLRQELLGLLQDIGATVN